MIIHKKTQKNSVESLEIKSHYRYLDSEEI